MITSRHRQTTAALAQGLLRLSGTDSSAQAGVPSPYFHTPKMRKEAPDRDTKLSLKLMAVNRAVVRDLEDGGGTNYLVFISYLDGTTGSVVTTDIAFFSPAGFNSYDDYHTAITSAVNSNAAGHGYTLSAGVVLWGATTTQINALIATALSTLPSSHAIEGTTSRTSPIPVAKSATVASGVAVFQLTDDGLSTGTSLFPNGVIKDSVSLTVSDATASYQMSYAFTNSDKTLTVTVNKLTTSNILTGILGQAAGNGAIVKLSVLGY